MTDTVISSASREVVIGFDRPFVVIGERINPTGRKLLAQEMKAGDFSRVEADALAQVAAGAHVLDVNAGIPLADEPALLARAVKLVQSLTDVPLSIDSSVLEALESGLAAYQGKALLNSVTGEEDRLERVLPLVKKHGAAVVAICNDDTGISTDIDVRFEVAKKIVHRAADYGIPACDAGDAGGRHGRRRRAGVQADPAAAGRAEGQHHLRRFQRQFRPAAPARPEPDLPGDGHWRRHDVGDHQPAGGAADAGGARGRRADGSRSAVRQLDQRLPSADRGREPGAPKHAPAARGSGLNGGRALT
jgi:hypothetical protein